MIRTFLDQTETVASQMDLDETRVASAKEGSGTAEKPTTEAAMAPKDPRILRRFPAADPSVASSLLDSDMRCTIDDRFSVGSYCCCSSHRNGIRVADRDDNADLVVHACDSSCSRRSNSAANMFTVSDRCVILQ